MRPLLHWRRMTLALRTSLFWGFTVRCVLQCYEPHSLITIEGFRHVCGFRCQCKRRYTFILYVANIKLYNQLTIPMEISRSVINFQRLDSPEARKLTVWIILAQIFINAIIKTFWICDIKQKTYEIYWNSIFLCRKIIYWLGSRCRRCLDFRMSPQYRDEYHLLFDNYR